MYLSKLKSVFCLFFFSWVFVGSSFSLENLEWLELWDDQENSTYFFADLEFGVFNWVANSSEEQSDGGIRFITRGYNNQLPGPIIRMKRGNTYRIRFHNKLLNTQSTVFHPSKSLNSFRYSNFTNIHFHGTHLSPVVDDPFRVIPPETSIELTYKIPENHAGGTFWYHPHLHGSVTLQLSGGGLGALIIEDDPPTDGIPEIYSNMKEVILVLQHFDLQDLNIVTSLSGDRVLQIDSQNSNILLESDFFLLNGDYQPRIELIRNQWYRLRIVFSSPTSNTILKIEDECDCSLQLIAKDGVFLREVPRKVKKLFFTPASRVDVAIRCSAVDVSSCAILLDDTFIVGNFDILSSPTKSTPTESEFIDDYYDPMFLPCWSPCFPDYLQDLVEEDTDNANWVGIDMGMVSINGLQFSGEEDDYLESIQLGEIQSWDISGTDQHPLHIHVNHFQIASAIEWEEVPGWTLPGDWIDTLSSPNFVSIRFRPLDHVGTMLIHCHILAHADQGQIALIEILPSTSTLEIEDSSKNCGLKTCNEPERPNIG